MRIESVRATAGVSGFFFDDQRAIKEGATQDGFTYEGTPVTEGFEQVRQPGESLLVEVVLDDGRIGRGDCAAVQYSGAGGRDPLFRADDYQAVVEGPVADALVGTDPTEFGDAAARLEGMVSPHDPSAQLHTAVRYGVSQALLDAAASAQATTKATVLADALDTTPATEPIPVFGQSGDDRRLNAEKMLCKRVGVLPHGLFNSVEKVGADGERLLEYVRWLSDRTTELAVDGYEPRFHVDVYGLFSEVFGPPYDREEVVDYVADLEAAADPFDLQLEGPMDEGGRHAQIHAMAELREGLADAGVDVAIVADEWCDTFDDVRAFVDEGAADLVQVKTPDLGGIQRSARAVRYCEGTDVRAYLGGTCNETDLSARTCAHVALATEPAQVLAKPGMGFDEGYTIVENEMRRTVRRHEIDGIASTTGVHQ
ncbi:methylaspartate ammonia-lyase [Haloarculaceae archaeon H-GB1-1]|nr:methylaspartate ammonia-lyase [Haloarculaceae archaeon H-GB1-1]